MRLKITIILFVFGVLVCPCYAADVLLVDLSPQGSMPGQQVDLASTFYGLDLQTFFVGESQDNLQVLNALERSEACAMVITANALPYINDQQILSVLLNESEKNMPLLIIGITPAIDSRLLIKWSGGAVIGCTSSTDIPYSRFYKVIDLKDIARELAGQDILFTTKKVFHLVLDEDKKSESIMEVWSKRKEHSFPVFIKTAVSGREMFFQAEMPVFNSNKEATCQYNRTRFFEIAPLMMFLRYSCAEKGWHSPGHYANLTIDDPWLTDPYGHLSYKGLLEQMQKNDFHTTIAFIPWNFDRSEPDVVALFRDHPDRFSLCIHGNNHDHREFYKYETGMKDPWQAQPLVVHEANIKQAIARMDEFKRLTKLAYDRVMVFPQGIAPEKTLGLLKKYNFLTTSNAGNVPLDSTKPDDELFWLRSVTLAFENFPSVNRYPAKSINNGDIAINLFLGNPILFYGHHELFKGGVGAFNETAELVNIIDPGVEWKSLGYIAQHLYLQRKRDDDNYDIRSFSKSVELENKQKRDVTYFIRKEESFTPSIKKVTVDGEPYPYQRIDSDISITIAIPAGESRLIDIEYENDLDLASIDVSKEDLRVNRLRKLSDFRDMILSKNIFGRSIIKVYYETGIYKMGLRRLVILLFVLAVLTGSTGWYLRQRCKKRCF